MAYLYQRGRYHGKIKCKNILNCYGTYKLSPIECGVKNLIEIDVNDPNYYFRADLTDLAEVLMSSSFAGMREEFDEENME